MRDIMFMYRTGDERTCDLTGQLGIFSRQSIAAGAAAVAFQPLGVCVALQF